ncbi:flagellar export protein FliJ [Microbacterium sp. CIAB417]|uniref:flagellar export protein FliJ n=1 Tax=Microbacterium sp. CIAB417 TaxID=2860287 RepID=UPI001FADC0D2|nr:hypothetical protein [Microbacterium sp. CIAB417]
MSRGFSLSGLLRVRGIQERAAAQRLSRAVIDADQAKARERVARAALDASGSDAIDVRTLAAIAAARVSARRQLGDLASLADLRSAALADARDAHREARRQVRALERLADAHAARQEAETLRQEQNDIDEIAGRARAEGAT